MAKRRRISPHDRTALIEGFKEYSERFPLDRLTKAEKREMKQIYKQLYPGRFSRFRQRRRQRKMMFGSPKAA